MGFLSFVERLRGGQTWYFNSRTMGNTNFGDSAVLMDIAKANPIVMPALNLIATYYTTARWYEKGAGGVLQENTPALNLLKKPNPFQTYDDFQKQYVWYKYVYGYLHQLPISTTNAKDVKNIKYLYNLKSSGIEFPKDFKGGLITTKSEHEAFLKQKILYEDKQYGFKRSPEVGDLLSFYDLANGLDGNPLTAPSRLKALKKPIGNIEKAFDAKNIVIQSNGKELVTNETVGNIAKIPLTTEEDKDIKKKLKTTYGVGIGQDRSIVTNSALKWQSLHIKLKELGLDESVINDAQTIINAFGIPPELFTVDGTSATFENQEKAVISFLQSKIQVELDDQANTYNNAWGTDLVAKLDHLPIMRSIEKSKVASLRSLAFAIKILVDAQTHSIKEVRDIWDDMSSKM